jgi:hypothetical protein
MQNAYTFLNDKGSGKARDLIIYVNIILKYTRTILKLTSVYFRQLMYERGELAHGDVA